MKKIVRGNDFVLRIPVAKMVGGEQYAFPLPACESIVVSVVNSYKRYALAHTIDTAEDNVLLATVEGDRMPCGTYALEVRGKLFGSDWRSNEYEQIRLVDNNEEADTEFSQLESGEDSVEMDTQIVVMGASSPAINPRGEWTEGTEYSRGDCVAHGTGCWWAAEDTTSEPSEGNSAWVLLCEAAGVKDAEVSRNRLVITFN